MIESMEAALAAMEIVKTLVLAVSPARVWRALTEPKELARWFPDQRADFEATPGAEGRWVWKNHGSFAVRVELVEPPTRLVWSWARDADTPLDETSVTTVEWRLEENPDGGTTLHLRETGFTSRKDLEGNFSGWDKELGELVAYLETDATA